jgi:hypothetical protein
MGTMGIHDAIVLQTFFDQFTLFDVIESDIEVVVVLFFFKPLRR